MIDIQDYDYYLPQELIAQKPSEPRDHSRLFVYDTKTDTIIFDRFYNLEKYLPKNSFLVLNQTKVVPSRISLRKKSGGVVKILFLINELPNYLLLTTSYFTIRGFVDRQVRLGEQLFIDEDHSVTVVGQQENIFTFKINFPFFEFKKILEEKGAMPIPPYIKHSPLTRDELKEKYQTIFAKNWGSAAAPTASLHFTDQIFEKLNKKKIQQLFITLHVGLGTFAPINEENIKNKKLHKEHFEIDQDTLQCINTLKSSGKKLVAVGTTVVRTLEGFTNSKVKSHLPAMLRIALQAGKSKMQFKSQKFGKTDLFIFPPYDFKIVDCLITNFHLPKSSLMMLVEALLQHKHSKRHLVDLYQIAIQEKFNFFSFGDAMLII